MCQALGPRPVPRTVIAAGRTRNVRSCLDRSGRSTVTGCEITLRAVARQVMTARLRRSRPKALYPRTMRSLRGGRGTGQEIAAFTSSATFFSAMGLHFLSAYDTGHASPSSRFAASWKPRVE